MTQVQGTVCRQCGDAFRFIRYGKRPRIYCEVCRELRIKASIQRFKDKLSETEKRAAARENAFACHGIIA